MQAQADSLGSVGTTHTPAWAAQCTVPSTPPPTDRSEDADQENRSQAT